MKDKIIKNINLHYSHHNRHHNDIAMSKLVKLFIIFGPYRGNHAKVIKKYSNSSQIIMDESLMSTLCLPKIEYVDKPKSPRFQTFLVTKEDGQVLYGSGLIVYERAATVSQSKNSYVSHCYTLITDTPFIHATKSLLNLIWEKKSDDNIIRAVMNIPLPARRACLRITYSPFDDIYLYRGMSDLPILDYPLRELFTFLQIDDLLLAFTCILMEFRTLIISQDNYKLMMVGEALTTLLLPLKWCNVYVPILPPHYGATYLDAPTSYIMGINTQVTDLPENLNHVQCRIYCDENRVVCDADSLTLPLFLNNIKKDILKILEQFSATHQSRPFSYLDDLKFNRAIRILFIKTVRKNMLANYERYIIDVPDSSSEIRQFDVVSYLSDQPEFMHSFLSRFLDTQLFASFIDENAKRMQQSWLSIFDMDPEELSQHFTDEALDIAFKNAQKVQLKNLSLDQTDVEVNTVPASPMKLRHRVPVLLRNRLNFRTKYLESANSISIDKENELIEEVKDLTKRILVEIMGGESDDKGYTRYSDVALIGTLCDLIERVWAHGAFMTNQGNGLAFCPLWNHLMTFTRLMYLDSKQSRREFFDGSHLNVLSSTSYQFDKSEEFDVMLAHSGNIFQNFKWFKSNKRQEVGPLVRDLISDLMIINKLEDVKTGVGKARAFIRLSLEKKKLSKHLKTLLSDQALLTSLYKPYAFLLHEDEREQFLMYLLTLNAVDLPCFTTTFINVINTRRMKTAAGL